MENNCAEFPCDKDKNLLTQIASSKCLTACSLTNCVLVLGGLISYGMSLPAVVSYFQGESLVLANTHSVGALEEGRRYTFGIPISNASSRPIRITGAQTSCGCTTLTGLPLTLAPREKRTLEIQVAAIRRMGEFDSRIDLFVDQGNPYIKSFQIQGTIVPSGRSNGSAR